ncbi:catenin delta-1-like isoform X1 [Syngnathoides biaculeatus]|uniref:catenin delta-1-like isoform X1 n=2 Tax=Syngnathoides biaculeatus TaxID=300417 RepID=UPI002ADDB9D7|nr:catenin delta-1-like isoform X1 [Syngnathoides biaculeatus]XP_061692020.1 catenin delta-1-like isoform X1 [Syngnathoides biaculeatus]XP_061692021.1 catenin delta-1-like isoform X1 [Syngnathoides biaculeatus]XP_061692022.1 catenin delta-1-like isoform X1 [Syngnathoides biaculeatus]XP_061692023.1 catenin delta-1-like isoform X1 [Syngnathoides biaculeatus]
MEQCESAAALLESVREQEVQFEQLTRALEEERRRAGLSATSPSALGRPLPHMQNGCFGDADIERLKLTDSYINNTQYRMVDPAHSALDESYTPEDDSHEAHSVFSEEGTTRRLDNGMKKPMSRTVLPNDSMSINGGMPMSGMCGYSATLDRPYRQMGGDYPTATVPRNYHYGPVGVYDDYRGGPPSEAYTSLSRGSHMDDRYRPIDGYRTLDSGYRAPSRQQMDPYAAQPQVGRGLRAMGSAMDMRYGHGHYGLEDDQRSVGFDEYSMGPPPMHPGGYGTMPRLGPGPGGMERRRLRSCEDTLDGDMGGVDPYAWGVPMTLERGSMASLDSTLRKGPPSSWRQPELPEVIAMLNYRLDPVKTNAAAFLQHLTFKNDKVKSEVRRLKGIPALVSLLDHPSKDVHHSACGALKNISYGRDPDNKIAIKNCDGVPALVRLLRKTHDQDLTDTITGTLWNLSSHDSVKMEIVDHALHALADEVIVPHSGWERADNGREESCKPRHLEWETALTNTAGCLRNVSSERSEARRKLRECSGLVDSLMYIVQSQINRKDVDNKLVENCMCLLRNLSYQVHREVPSCERYAEIAPINQGTAPGSNKSGCFGSRKGKDEWFSKGKKDGDDENADQVDIPKRTMPAKGYELLFQPEVVRIYTSLLRESKNPSVLEAAAGAIQNLCAGRWTYGRYIRATVRLEKGLPMMAELLAHGNDRVVRAMSGALRNLSIDNRNCELLGLHAVPHLVANLPGGQSQSGRALSEETVVSVLSTLAEVLGTSLEAAKTLRASQGIERLVLINKDGKRSDREVRGAGQVLQLVWAHKELRRPLEKDGWKKTDFQVNLNSGTTNGPSTRGNGTYGDSTTPLLDRGEKRSMIPLNDLGCEADSTLDQRERRHTLDDTDTFPRGVYGGRKGSLPLLDSYDG